MPLRMDHRRMRSSRQAGLLHKELEELARRFGPGQLGFDPVRFPRAYAEPRDREVAALVSALLAYGNVKAMGDYLGRLLARLEPSPAAILAKGSPKLRPGPYRFQTGNDVDAFLGAVGRVLRDHGSLEAAFCAKEGTPEDRIEALAVLLRAAAGTASPGLLHLLPLPSGGSACKRWWMFLRWVSRPDDGVDLGLWTCVSPSELRMPVDTHVARIAYALGLTTRKTADRAFAVELTDSLRAFCPEDPTRYDFALAHLGISRACRGRRVRTVCEACSLRAHCAIGK